MSSVRAPAARQLLALTIVGAAAAITAGLTLGGLPRTDPAMLSASDTQEHQEPAAAASEPADGQIGSPPVPEHPPEPLVILPENAPAAGASRHCSGGPNHPRVAARSARWPAWASTSGNADLHAFAYDTDASRYVLFLYVRWDKPGRAALTRTGAQEWRQTLAVDLPADAQLFRIDHWTSDLPGACLDAWVTGRTLKISVSVRKPLMVQVGRRYDTQMLATAPESITGQPWSYDEQAVGHPRRLPGHDLTRWASPPRRGAVGTCGTCYAAWAVR